MPFRPPNQQCQSTEGNRQLSITKSLNSTEVQETCAIEKCSTNASHFVVSPVDVTVDRVVVDGYRVADIADVQNNVREVSRI